MRELHTAMQTFDAEVDALVADFEARNPEPHTYSCDRCGDMGYHSASGSWSADDDVPCTDCRAIGYESSPYGPDGGWGPES